MEHGRSGPSSSPCPDRLGTNGVPVLEFARTLIGLVRACMCLVRSTYVWPFSKSLNNSWKAISYLPESFHLLKSGMKYSRTLRARSSPVSLSKHFQFSICSKGTARSEEHTSELQSLRHLVCRLL